MNGQRRYNHRVLGRNTSYFERNHSELLICSIFVKCMFDGRHTYVFQLCSSSPPNLHFIKKISYRDFWRKMKRSYPVMPVVNWLLLLYIFFFFLFGDTPPSKNIPYEDHVRADNFNRLINVKPSKSVDVKTWYITSVLFNWSI